jgi:hypothetical protein
MKLYQQLSTWKAFSFLSLLILVSSLTHQGLSAEDANQSARIVPDDEIPAILQLIGAQIKDNYERISTWSGEINAKITWVWSGANSEEFFQYTNAKGNPPRAMMQKVEEKKIFAVDAKKNLVYLKETRNKNEYFDYSTGINLGRKHSYLHSSVSIARPDYIVTVSPQSFEKGTDRILHCRAVKKLSEKEQQTRWYKYKDIWDPRRAFFPGADFTWDVLDVLANKVERFGKIEFDGYKLKIEEITKDDDIQYTIVEPTIVNMERSKPQDYAILTKVFSSQCGFNMTSWQAADGSGRVFQKYTWEYQLVNGIYVPKRTVMQFYDPNGVMTTEHDFTYENNKVNQEIPPETFEISNLKLKEGDIFKDEIENKEYRYKASTKTFQPITK